MATLGRVLVVDDDDVIRRLLKGFLEKKGYEVVLAVDGNDALDKVRTERPTVVLLDITMPQKSGFEVLKEIKRSDAGIGVIMVTAHADDAIGREALALGAFDYVSKPFDLEYLEKVLWWRLQLVE